MSLSAALTRGEKGRLKSCEAVIERGKTVFVEVGQALTEIRDAKLYRDTHSTFDAYCRERWDIGRSRAYELIDQAKIVEAINVVGGDLSVTADISKRDVRALQADLPAAASAIRERVQAGQDPKQATAEVIAETRSAKEAAKQQRAAEQAEHDRQRDEVRATLPSFVAENEAAKKAAIDARQASAVGSEFTSEDRIAELEEAVRTLEAEIEELRVENKLYGEMKAEWQKGGFEAVIAGKDEALRVAAERTLTEHNNSMEWRKNALWWKSEAQRLGWKPDRMTIDNETGEVRSV